MFDLSEFMKPVKPLKQTVWRKPPAVYVTGDLADRVYDNGYENGLLAGAQAERERIIKLLENSEWDDVLVATPFVLRCIALIKGEEQ